MEYKHLTPDQQEQMLVGRIQQLEAEHFGHTLNAEALDIATDISDEAKERQRTDTENSITTIEAAHKIATEKLDAIRAAKQKRRESRSKKS